MKLKAQKGERYGFESWTERFLALIHGCCANPEPWIDLSGEVAWSEEGPGVIWRVVGEGHLERGG